MGGVANFVCGSITLLLREMKVKMGEVAAARLGREGSLVIGWGVGQGATPTELKFSWSMKSFLFFAASAASSSCIVVFE